MESCGEGEYCPIFLDDIINASKLSQFYVEIVRCNQTEREAIGKSCKLNWEINHFFQQTIIEITSQNQKLKHKNQIPSHNFDDVIETFDD